MPRKTPETKVCSAIAFTKVAVRRVEYVAAHTFEADDAPLDTAVGTMIPVPDAYYAHTSLGKIPITEREYKRLQKKLGTTS